MEGTWWCAHGILESTKGDAGTNVESDDEIDIWCRRCWESDEDRIEAKAKVAEWTKEKTMQHETPANMIITIQVEQMVGGMYSDYEDSNMRWIHLPKPMSKA